MSRRVALLSFIWCSFYVAAKSNPSTSPKNVINNIRLELPLMPMKMVEVYSSSPASPLFAYLHALHTTRWG